jgi:hypothetical protein
MEFRVGDWVKVFKCGDMSVSLPAYGKINEININKHDSTYRFKFKHKNIYPKTKFYNINLYRPNLIREYVFDWEDFTWYPIHNVKREWIELATKREAVAWVL